MWEIQDEFEFNPKLDISPFARFDGIFGGGGSDVSQGPTLTSGQRSLLDQITDLLGGQVGRGVTPFQGTRPGEVPFGPLQQQAFGLAGGLAPGIGAGLGLFNRSISGFDPSQGQQFLGQAGQALQRGLDFDPTQNILQALEPGRQLALRTFERDIVPNLLERFGASSGPSGPLNRAFAEASADLSLGLGAQAQGFLGQAALQQPGVQFQGAGLAGQFAGIPGQLAGQGAQLGGLGAGLLSQLFNIGGLQQQLPIGQAAAQQARFQEGQPFNNPFLAQLLGPALGTQAFTNIVQPQGGGLGSALLPGLGAFAGAGGFSGLFGGAGAGGNAVAAALPFFSDERIKENVKPMDNALGKVKQLSGFTYNYKFNHSDNRNGGVMAQHLEKVLPDAVSEIDGIKFVRYDAVIGLLVNAVNELARKVG